MPARPTRRLLATLLLTASLPLAACGSPEPPAAELAPDETAAASAPQALFGIEWPNLMLLDGEMAYDLTAAARTDKSRFRVHLDVDLQSANTLDLLRDMLKKPSKDEAGIRAFIWQVAQSNGASPEALGLIDSIPFNPGAASPPQWPTHELFVDYAQGAPMKYGYRMEMDFVIAPGVRTAIEDAFRNADVAALKAAVRSTLPANPHAKVVALINAISF